MHQDWKEPNILLEHYIYGKIKFSFVLFQHIVRIKPDKVQLRYKITISAYEIIPIPG